MKANKKYNIVTIIVHFNEAEFCRNIVNDLLLLTEIENRIVVVDNESNVEVRNELKEYFSCLDIDFICNPKNIGFGGGVNCGAKFAEKYSPSYFHIINTDTHVINPRYLYKLYEILEKESNLALVGPAVKKINGEIQNTIMPLPSLKSIVLYKSENSKNSFVSKPPKVVKCEVVNGVCFLVRASAFFAVNGFDEDYFMYVEEQDFAFKIKHCGNEIAFVSVESIIHFGADNFQKYLIDWKYVYSRKNIVMYLHKRKKFISAFIASLFFSVSVIKRKLFNNFKIEYLNLFYIVLKLFFPKK